MRVWSSLLLVAFVALGLQATAFPIPSHSESFETGWGSWTADHYLHCEEHGDCVLDWSLERSQAAARNGAWGLESYIDGRYDDGVVWAETSFAATPGTPVPVSIVFHVLSKAHSDINNWYVVAYLGDEDPEREGDFTILGETDRGHGWRAFCHAGVVMPGADGTVWAGFGISVIWETPRTYHMDDVSVGIGASAVDCAGGPLCLLAELPVCALPGTD